MENDRVHEFSAEIIFGQVDTRLVARIEPGPCPWFVGVTQADVEQFYTRAVRFLMPLVSPYTWLSYLRRSRWWISI